MSKNGEQIKNESSHLTCYEIEDNVDEPEQVVSVSYQLAEQALVVDEPELLCVPSEKIVP